MSKKTTDTEKKPIVEKVTAQKVVLKKKGTKPKRSKEDKETPLQQANRVLDLLERRTVVGVDMDGVVVDLCGHLLQVYGQSEGPSIEALDPEFKRAGRYTTEIIKTWDIHRHVPHGKLIYEYFDSESFWLKPPAVTGAVQAMYELHNAGYDLEIVSSPWLGKPMDCEQQKRAWIMRHLPFIDQKKVTFTHQKQRVCLDLLIDDKPTTCQNYPWNVVCFGQPWNQSQKDSINAKENAIHIDGWPKVVEYIKANVPLYTNLPPGTPLSQHADKVKSTNFYQD